MVTSPSRGGIEVSVPGRVCLFGEHSDWAGGHRRTNSDIQCGKCIVTGTDEVRTTPADFNHPVCFRHALPTIDARPAAFKGTFSHSQLAPVMHPAENLRLRRGAPRQAHLHGHAQRRVGGRALGVPHDRRRSPESGQAGRILVLRGCRRLPSQLPKPQLCLLGLADYTKVDMPGLRSNPVNFGAGKGPGSPEW